MTSHVPNKLNGENFVVRTNKLAKHFKSHAALHDVDFTVPEHAFYVLVGPNGAGKTTLLKLLIELIEPSFGEMTVLGLNPGTDGHLIRAQVGYVAERSDDLYTWMNVKDLLRMQAAYYPNWDHAYANQLIERFEIPMAKLSRLSKGQVRRVQVVIALAHRPKLLLLDEPTDGLDPVAREMFRSILAEHLADNPTTVIFSTHLVYEVESLADHLGVLRDGELVAQLRTDELKERMKRYITISENGANRETAKTMWGSPVDLRSVLSASGNTVRDVQDITLQEAAVALLSGDER